MVAVGLFAPVLYSPQSPLAGWLPPEPYRGMLMGTAMGLTAMGLIYSPLGAFSGALMNPATTLAFMRLGKLSRLDAAGYIIAQCVGGLLGCTAVGVLVGPRFTDPPLSYAPTIPGGWGVWWALAAELAMSCIMMVTVLRASNSARLAPYTGVLAGFLVMLFIATSAPISGFSINPARTLASAVPSGVFDSFWIYIFGPIAGMLLGAQIHLAFARHPVHCCKLNHSSGHCPHCGCDGPIHFDAHQSEPHPGDAPWHSTTTSSSSAPVPEEAPSHANWRPPASAS